MRKPGRDRLRRHGDSTRVEDSQQRDRNRRVCRLVRTREADREGLAVARRDTDDLRPRLTRGTASIASDASGSSGPTTTGTPGLMMPAFSNAIARNVDPRYA
jgi:hypothetical protein